MLYHRTGLIRRHGAFVEKWEGVDDVKIDYLLEDSRYPYLPTWTGYLSNFAQPSNWGDNFGSRIRTYFVPLQTGYHVFYLRKLCPSKRMVYSGSSVQLQSCHSNNQNRALITS